ncbi:MAG: methyltransferase domain-containing protein [Pontiellaceae bacterium]|nr:methyltransferase domain-containing protein [Pontiellaceae bacterium]MBN2783994.1 methyltransferase domain-containing protein [Pontiellaceae bacterium]
MKHSTCPCCRGSDLEDFFTIRNAPTQSLVTIKDRDVALAIPRQDIVLTFCNGCGFIFNSEFDTSIDYYTQGYEDQQGFSPTFVKFITGVTERFIDRYDIRQKQVVEIGCGKGDFIRLMSKLGDNKGVGIDPAWVPGRGEDAPNVRFIKEFYSSAHGDIEADCITCRHTMEHIHDTIGIMKTVRASCRDARPVLFFEVPSIVRILDIQAFWDIFYEHCSYFGPGAFARLFRKAGFEVLDMYLEYDKQYLFLEARPVSEPSDIIHPLEESIDELREKTRVFAEKMAVQLGEWTERLKGYKAAGKKVVVWGGGSKSVGFLTQFADLGVIEHVVDINPHMQGNFIPCIGIQYSGPDFLKEYNPDVVIVMNSVYMEEIRHSLAERGLHPEMVGL